MIFVCHYTEKKPPGQVLRQILFAYSPRLWYNEKNCTPGGVYTLNPSVYELFSAALPELPLLQGEPLCEHTSFRIGGPAELMLLPRSAEELSACLRLCDRHGLTPRVLGAGTNVLAPDEGLSGAVILTKGLTGLRLVSDAEIEADCGVSLAKLASFAQRHGLTGLEFAHGIPGTVGGGLYMNAGAYGGELSQVTVQTDVLRPDGSFETVRGQAQGLGYRHSAFMDSGCVIVRGRFRLQKGDPEQVRAKMRELSEKRRASQPLDLPSAGSTFKRPATGYAAALIDRAGLKGFRVGGAAVSQKHAGFVVNLGGATAQDVLKLMRQVQETVYADSGVKLEPEVRIW